MKIAIVTMFGGLTTTYSLVNVVADHLKMLIEAGHEVKMLVSEDCPDGERFGPYSDPRVEWVKITNRLDGKQIHWQDYSQPYGKVHDSFLKEAEAIAEDFAKQLKDADVCILHDILYQGWHLVHNVAIRMAQKELPHLRFVSFTHSLPVNHPPKLVEPFAARYTPMPNTTYVYPTLSGLAALAKQYGVPEGKCRAVSNTYPLLENASVPVQKVHAALDLLSPDVVIVYPGRLTPAKKFEKVAAFAGAIHQKTERSVHIVFCDFPSADISCETYKNSIRMAGKLGGLDEGDMLFTSEIGFPNGFPRESVLELMTLSNLFVCPSFSESFGLTVLEAAAKGNFLVLNEAVPALEELGKKLHAYFMRWDARSFGFDTKENYEPSEAAYYAEHAQRVVTLMREDRVLYAKTLTRQRYSPKWVFENQLEPLL
ncbi:MAG: glycosyltransferase [Clostridia bacterium]